MFCLLPIKNGTTTSAARYLSTRAYLRQAAAYLPGSER